MATCLVPKNLVSLSSSCFQAFVSGFGSKPLIMDKISQLPDPLLLKILSLLPTKDVVTTMVLSKRWQFLWMVVPRLEYNDDMYQDGEDGRFLRFVYSSLLLYEAPVLEIFCLKLGQKSGAIDIGVCLKPCVNRFVRELIIEIDTCSGNDTTPVTLPRSLYTCFRMLVTLKLSNAILVDHNVSSPISFPFLKKLSLISMRYPDVKFVEKLLSCCRVLEDLDVGLCSDDNVDVLSVRVPSLKSLVLHTSKDRDREDVNGFVIDAPSLEFLKIVDYNGGFSVVENNMPKLVKAHVSSAGLQLLLLKSIASVKRLYLCFPTSKSAYPVGSVFHRLVHLTLGTCETAWLNLLMCLLRDSPSLRALKLEKCHEHEDEEPRPSWSEPASVPECLLSSLETVEWTQYEGTEEEKEVAAFILRSGNFLKKVTINPESTSHRKKLEMVEDLFFLPRCSVACQLAFE